MGCKETTFLRVISGEVRELTEEEKEKYKGVYKYVTLSTFQYIDREKKVVVPPGFLTDGSTGGPDYGSSWIFHDYLYATHHFEDGIECTREEADEIMVNILLNERLTWYMSVVALATKYNILWKFSRAWKNSYKRGAEFLDLGEECQD